MREFTEHRKVGSRAERAQDDQAPSCWVESKEYQNRLGSVRGVSLPLQKFSFSAGSNGDTIDMFM